MKIEHSGSIENEDAERYGKIIAGSALDELAGAFNMRGIGRINSAVLKQK